MKILSGIVLAGLICVLFGSLYSTEIKADEPEPGSYMVTYKVANGKWNDDTTGDKSETVEDNGYLAHIPAVGNKPSSGFKAGS